MLVSGNTVTWLLAACKQSTWNKSQMWQLKMSIFIKDSLVRCTNLHSKREQQVNLAFCIKTCQLPNVKMASISIQSEFKIKREEYTVYVSWHFIWIILSPSTRGLRLFNTQTKIKALPIHKMDYFCLGSSNKKNPHTQSREWLQHETHHGVNTDSLKRLNGNCKYMSVWTTPNMTGELSFLSISNHPQSTAKFQLL